MPRDWTGGGSLPTDWVHAVYNGLLAALWFSLLSRADLAAPLCLVHLGATTLPWLLRRAPARLAPPVAVLREYYPLLWLASYWFELGALIPLLQRGSHDAWLIHMEFALFGLPWHTTGAVLGHGAVNQLMYWLYAAYLPLLVLTPIAVGIMGRIEIVRELAFRLSLVAILCFVTYLLWPVAGPSHYPVELPAPPASGVGYHGMLALRSFGDAIGSAFPSSHVALSASIAIVGWRWLPRWPAVALITLVIGIAVACVYTGNHYVVDVVAGGALALAAQRQPMTSPQVAAGALHRARVPERLE